MKLKILFTLLSITALSGLALPARADDAVTVGKSQRDSDEATATRRKPIGELREARHIIGMEIKNLQNERLGTVKDLALDLQNGRIAEVIVARGGILGMDAKLTAVPPSLFSFDESRKILRLDIDREKLKSAPEFQMSQWKEETDEARIREVCTRYQVHPYYGNISEKASNLQSNDANSTNSTATDTAEASQARAEGNRGQASHYYPLNGTNGADQTAGIANQTNGNGYESRPMTLGYVTRASKVMGATAKNEQNETLGKVKNLVVDLPAGRIVELMLASGGFLGIDNELSAVPPQSLRWNSENDTFTLDTTREALKAAPHFKESNWQEAQQPARVSEVYSTYHVQPYFADADVDNTGRNVRDRSENSTTPFAQGNNKEDIDTTAQIRKALMSDHNLSVDAQNVKIITADGHVTLRGPVNNKDEKRMIADTATRVAGTDKVDNQLEVKGNTNPATTPDSNK